MTIGDEPSLPQPADDNAPMISGRGTKVIADARGAYLARNFDAMIDVMNDSQRVRLENAIVRQATLFAASFLATECSSYPEDWRLAIQKMLDEPTSENADQVRQLISIQYLGIFGVVASLINMPFTTSQFIFAALMSRQLLSLDFRHAMEWAYDWRIETAWAIFQGKQPSFVDTCAE